MLKKNFSKVQFFSLIFICLALISCGNRFDDSAAKTSSPSAQTFVLTGTMVLDGAMPQFETEQSSDDASRSALPLLSSSSVEYFVYATDGDDNTVDGSFSEDENSKTFSIPLAFNKEWTITCGMRNISGSKEEFLTASSIPKTYTTTNYTDPVVLYPVPAATGKGEVALSMTIAPGITDVTVSCISSSSDSWNISSVDVTPGSGNSNGTAVLKTGTTEASKLDAGVYKIKLSFLKGTEMVFQTIQSINVFYGLKTNRWYDAAGTGFASVIQSNGSFVLSDTVLKQFKATNFYVGPVSGATPLDTNAGTHKAPFKTLERALKQIEDYGLPENDYKIYICDLIFPDGADATGYTIPTSLDNKMKSLTLMGVTGNTVDNISGVDAFRALTISTSKNVTIRDLKISEGADSNGAGIYYNGTGKLTIENCVISGNNATGMGGGIYSTGNVSMISTKIIGNTSDDTGEAIFVFSGTFTMSGGEISQNESHLDDSGAVTIRKGAVFNFNGGAIKNNKCRGIHNLGTVNMTDGTISGHHASPLGAGIYNNGSLTMSGGTITDNYAIKNGNGSGNGGGVYIAGALDGVTPSFTMTGGNIKANRAESYGGGICNASLMTITGGEISDNRITGTTVCGGAAITSFLDFTLGDEIYIPSSTEYKNDIYLYDSGDSVTKFHVKLSAPLVYHDSTDKIMLTPAEHVENRPMIALAANSTSDLSVECSKFGVTTDATQPALVWSVDTEGKLKYTVPLLTTSADASSFDGATAISGSPVFKSTRSFETIKSLVVSDHETTQGEYETYCTYSDSTKVPNAAYGVGEYYPAYFVTWYDAIVYCNLRSLADNLTPVYSVGGITNPTKWNGIVSTTVNSKTVYCAPKDCDWYVVIDDTKNGWRLPYEAEWEYLWREGNLSNENQHAFSGSDTPGDVAWYSANSLGKTHVVKTKSANALQIYDMSGNVWEWMNDWHRYPIPDNTPITGVSYATSTDKNHVTRGGGFGSVVTETTNGLSASGARGTSQSNFRNADMGFRVVHNVEETTDAYPIEIPTDYIGTKGPTEVREVGDIIFKDGSAAPYTDHLVLTDTQKAAAIAVIFYKGNGLNKEGDNSIRTLGVGLAQLNAPAWSTGNAVGQNITAIQGGINSGDKYGKDNLEDISAFLTNAHLNNTEIEDDTGSLSNYPAFAFAINYKDTASSHVAGSSFEEQWYLPTMSELYAIYNVKAIVNAAIALCDGTEITTSYWSSNQNSSHPSNANNLRFGDGFMTPNGTTMTTGFQMRSFAIREF